MDVVETRKAILLGAVQQLDVASFSLVKWVISSVIVIAGAASLASIALIERYGILIIVPILFYQLSALLACFAGLSWAARTEKISEKIERALWDGVLIEDNYWNFKKHLLDPKESKRLGMAIATPFIVLFVGTASLAIIVVTGLDLR